MTAVATIPLESVCAWLYVPAVRPELVPKAAIASDGIILDLEDSVHPERKADARAALADILAEELPVPVVVRVNPVETRDFERDIRSLDEFVRAGRVRAIRVAKVESPDDARLAGESVAEWGSEPRLICQLESARAVADAHEIGRVPGVHSLMLGEADLRADLGVPRGEGSDRGLELSRATVVLAARANGLPAPVGSAFTSVSDSDGLLASSLGLRSLGFFGRSCIHPRQVEAVRRAFAPDAEQLAWAEDVLAKASAMDVGGSASDTLGDGTFIDPAVVRQAELIRARAVPTGGAR